MGFLDELFTTPPKRITKNDLYGRDGFFGRSGGIYSRLRGGDLKGQLDEHHEKILKAIVDGHLDARGRIYDGIHEKDMPLVIEQIKESGEFTPNQLERIENELNKVL